MDPQQMIDTAATLNKRLERLAELRAKKEKDGLSRRDKAEIEKIRTEAQELNKRLELDPRAFQPNGRTATRDAGDSSDALTREQRLADWVREHRGGSSSLLDDADSGERLSLGAILQATVTGDHRELTGLERRALAEGTDATGGVLVPEELSSNIIDRARSASVVLQAGAVTAPMISDTLVLARLAGGNSANWKVENAAVSESDQVWERLELKTKTLVVLQRLSQELFSDLSDEGRRAIEHEIAQGIALKLDLAALEGSGVAPEPRGIANTSNVNSVSMGTNGAKPTAWDQVVQAAFAVLKANGAQPTAAVFHPRDLETYALLKDTTNQPLRKPDAITQLPLLSSSQISTTRTQGTSTDTSEAYIGDFSQLIVGVRPSLQIRLQVLSERYADNLQIGLLAWLRADVALAHPEHFTKIVGLRNV